VKQEKKHTEVV